MNDIVVTVIGNVCHEVRHTVRDDGLHIASFRLAHTPRRFNRTAGNWEDGDTVFLTVTCWRWLAENVASSVTKGDPVMVTGRLKVREWERDGVRNRSIEVDATSVGHDLSKGVSSFRRPRRLDAGQLSAELALVAAENEQAGSGVAA